MKLYKYILLFALITPSIGFSQRNEYSIGLNTSFLYNKVSSGLNVMLLKEEKNDARPNWVLQFNYGLLGSKNINQNEPDTTDGNIIFYNSQTFSYDIAPLNYYTKQHAVKNIGWSIRITKEFRLYKNLFFGLGIGHANIKDKGYLIWENPFNGSTIKKNINIDVSTIYFISNLGYYYNFNKKWCIITTLNLFFHTPVTIRSKDDKRYELNGSELPNIGSEQDLTISMNYKF